ncbi:HAD family phosphatase [Periweissella fabaria]|uniref:Pyridoxal phosphate phosphatase YigL n=1 Tax=Periweissella fabaria TaxID=546157 RepID=A0ABM8Z781_9LACO|nr:Cof-type HAD-IIB family hydrolase [Periweissella fabaria]MCM0597740.1 HAD family phosphatase [Periweissella fabaria]CAH0417189.1 Pyridoxal phosphate phosphatase YigL [Periweissella fabaria]
MYKMMVSDLDETLLNDDGTINAQNVTLIKRAIATGFKFVPNTGRSFKSVQPLLKQLALDNCPAQYVISYNGAAIVENLNNQIINTRGLEFSLAQQILAAGLIDPTIDAHIYTVDELYIYNISASDKAYMAERGVTYTLLDKPDITFLQSENIMKVIFETSDDDLRVGIKTAVCAQVGKQVEVTFSSQRYVEFNKIGTNKGQATTDLADKLGYNMDEVIAIGDNSNDISMIKTAGLGVAVANAIPDVKTVAKHITQKTNNEGAVAEVLQEYVLSKQ